MRSSEPIRHDNTCSRRGCGARVCRPTASTCLAHSPSDLLPELLEDQGPHDLLDGRGLTIDQDLVDAIVANATSQPPLGLAVHLPGLEPRAYLPGARFDAVTFAGPIDLSRIVFVGPVSFAYARFEAAMFRHSLFMQGAAFFHARFAGPASFLSASFHRSEEFVAVFDGFDVARSPGGSPRRLQTVAFDDAVFEDWAVFNNALFGGRTSFARVAFRRAANLNGSKFTAPAVFQNAGISSDSSFASAQFDDATVFDGATLGADVDFGKAQFGTVSLRAVTFGPRVSFSGCTFRERASFAGARFATQARFGPLVAERGLDLDYATFEAGADIALRAPGISAIGLKVGAGGGLRISDAFLTLEAAQFESATTLDGGMAHGADLTRSFGGNAHPKITSLRGADVGGLSVSGVDFRGCRFAGVHNLDRLHFGSDVEFGQTPTGLHAGAALPPVWVWTTRRVVPEEARWRMLGRKSMGWMVPSWRTSPVDTDERPLDFALLRFLIGVRDRIEQRTRVHLPDDTLEATARCSESLGRGERDRTDVALDLLEAAIAARLRREPAGPELEALRAALDALEEEIEDVRISKEEAIDRMEYEEAAGLRDRERALITTKRDRAADLNRQLVAWISSRWGPSERPSLAVEDVQNVAEGWAGADREPEHRPGPTFESPDLDPSEIATLYRSLRKGREDQKDAPGAADFYFGEMEMRRNSTSPLTAEGFVLFIYWLVSGYGLRSIRAVVSLAVVVGVLGVLMQRFGFVAHVSLSSSVIYTAQSAIPGLTAVTLRLTQAGQIMRIALHLAGPILLGLALLSLRGRVQR